MPTDAVAATIAPVGRFGTPDDVLVGGLPLFHLFGQTCAPNVACAPALA